MPVWDFLQAIVPIGALKKLAGPLGEAAFAEAGAIAYELAAKQIAAKNAGKKAVELDQSRKDWLGTDFGSLVHTVRIIYGADLIPSINILGVKLKTGTIAQAFGDKVYVRKSHSLTTDKMNDEKVNQLVHLAHELVHVRQYHNLGKSLYKFGKAYFRGLYEADFSYIKNHMEVEAIHFHRCFQTRLFSSIAIREMWRSTLVKGFTSVMPFVLNSQQHFLAYNSSDGTAKIGRIHSDGTGSDTIWSTTTSQKWTKGWTSFVPFVLGGKPYYLAYKSGSGQVAIDRIRADGKGVDTIWPSQGVEKWTKGWTSFVPFSLGGKPCYLAYKRGNGEVAIDRIRADGKGVDTLWPTQGVEKWTKGWSSFVPFVMNGAPHYLAYKEGSGTVHIDRIRDGGQGVDNVWQGQWSDKWTSMIGFRFQGRPHILSYKNEWGYAHVDSVNDGGVGTTHLWCDKWTKGWTAFFPFSLNAKPFHFVYKKNAGTAAIDSIGAV
jgi:hypothetical protein